jgi:DNA-binding LacI/PurR family transcriptional regulator
MATTVKDVAKRAGVSTATVSRVLTGSTNVSDELRERVQKAVDELGYKPSRVARSLRTRTRRILGVIVGDIRNPFFTSLVRGIEDVAHHRGYSLILCNADEDPEKEELYIDVLVAEHVGGAIVVPIREESTAYAQLIENGIPVVAADRKLTTLEVDSVLLDNELGAYLGVSHLLRQGYPRIGVIAGPLHTTTGRERLRGYERALRERRIELDPSLVKIGDFKQASGFRLAHELLNLDDPPAAIFAANNMMAIGASQAIHDRGLSIPSDTALVGFGDMPWASLLHPALTVVAQPTRELGNTAANVLLRRIAEPDGPIVEARLKPSLVIRESCGCALAGGSDAVATQLMYTETG